MKKSKIGRNKEFCKQYKLEGRREKNAEIKRKRAERLKEKQRAKKERREARRKEEDTTQSSS